MVFVEIEMLRKIFCNKEEELQMIVVVVVQRRSRHAAYIPASIQPQDWMGLSTDICIFRQILKTKQMSNDKYRSS